MSDSHKRGDSSRNYMERPEYKVFLPGWPTDRARIKKIAFAIPENFATLGPDEKVRKDHFLASATHFGLEFSGAEGADAKVWVCPFDYDHVRSDRIDLVWTGLPVEPDHFRSSWLMIQIRTNVHLVVTVDSENRCPREIRSRSNKQRFTWCSYPVEELVKEGENEAGLTLKSPTLLGLPPWQVNLSFMPHGEQDRWSQARWEAKQITRAERRFKT